MNCEVVQQIDLVAFVDQRPALVREGAFSIVDVERVLYGDAGSEEERDVVRARYRRELDHAELLHLRNLERCEPDLLEDEEEFEQWLGAARAHQVGECAHDCEICLSNQLLDEQENQR